MIKRKAAGLLFTAITTQWSVRADEQLKTILTKLKPSLFAPNTVSTNQFEYGSSLSPDGKSLLL